MTIDPFGKGRGAPQNQSLGKGSVAGPSQPLDKAHADLKKACQQFEAYFLDSLFKEMRKTVPKDKLLGDDAHQQEIFQEMMDQNVADSVSKQGGFGLADMMYRQLSPALPSGEADTAAKKPAASAGDIAPESPAVPAPAQAPATSPAILPGLPPAPAAPPPPAGARRAHVPTASDGPLPALGALAPAPIAAPSPVAQMGQIRPKDTDRDAR